MQVRKDRVFLLITLFSLIIFLNPGCSRTPEKKSVELKPDRTVLKAEPKNKNTEESDSPAQQKSPASSLFIPIKPGETPGSDNLQLLAAGDAEYLKGNFEEALRLYRESLEKKPDNDDAYIRIGDIYLRKGEYEKAGDAFRSAVSLNPGNKYAHFGYSDILMENGSYDEAEKHLLKSLEIDPEFAVAYTTLGDLYVDREDYEKALQFFEKSLEIQPEQDYPDTYIGLGELSLELEEYQKALGFFKTAIEKDPYDPDCYLGAARSSTTLGNYESAAEYYAKCYEINPDHLEAGTDYVEFLIGARDHVKASEVLEHLKYIYPEEEDFRILENRINEIKNTGSKS